jgi:hypothetical protein
MRFYCLQGAIKRILRLNQATAGVAGFIVAALPLPARITDVFSNCILKQPLGQASRFDIGAAPLLGLRLSGLFSP